MAKGIEKTINIAKRYGFDIAPLDVNKSGTVRGRSVKTAKL